MPQPLPSYDDIAALPALVEATVEPAFIDVNGHMNIRHYLDCGATSADLLIRRVGIDDEYRSQRRLGVFTAEHHLRYATEMHEGDAFSGHTVVVDRSARAAHLLSVVLDRSHGVVSCTVEIVLVHVDMDIRRPARFPDDVAAGLDRHVAATQQLAWPLPLSGAMGIRR